APRSARDADEAVPSPPRATRPPRPIDERWQYFLRTPKGYLVVVFAFLGGLALPALGAQRVVPHVLSAVAAACLVEACFVRRERGVWRFSSGALLTGLIVAFVLSPDEPWFAPLVAGALAV